ncbi:MAG: hypothetical protein ABEI86_10135 [Halobacteriaceae archaeon]
MTQFIVENGHIIKVGRYAHQPLYQIINAQVMTVTSVNYKIATLFSTSAIQTFLLALLAYKITALLVGQRTGLMASLLVVTANYVLAAATGPVASTFAPLFLFLIVYLLFNFRRVGLSRPQKLLVLVFVTSLILTHGLTSLYTFVLLSGLWLIFKSEPLVKRLWSYPEIGDQSRVAHTYTYLISIVWTALLLWWTYSSNHLKRLVAMALTGFSSSYFGSTSVQTNIHVPITERVLVQLGSFGFFFLTAIGALYLVYNYTLTRDYNSGAYATSTVVVFACGPILFLLGGSPMINRWIYFSQILLSVPFAAGLLVLASLNRDTVSTLFVFLLVSCIAFSMVAHPRVSIDNDSLSPNTQLKRHFDESEIEAVDYFAKHRTTGQYLISDFSYLANPSTSLLRNIYGVDKLHEFVFPLGYYLRATDYLETGVPIQNEYNTLQDVRKDGNLLILREYVIKNEVMRLNPTPFGQTSVSYNLSEEVLQRANRHNSRIYDSGTVTGYVTD